MSNNRTQVLASVLALDAWHDPIRTDGSSSAIHVEVSFQDARIGGEYSDFPFTFRLSIAKATVIVRVEAPLQVNKSSIARRIPATPAQYSLIKMKRDEVVKSTSLGNAIDVITFTSTLKAKLAKNYSETLSQEQRIELSLPEILVNPKPIDNSSYCWELIPTFSLGLQGQPWHPIEHPRMYVQSQIGSKKPDAAILVSINCAREDLNISDIQLKDEISSFSPDRLFKSKREAVAVQHIKRVLASANIHVGALDNRFSDLIIGQTASVEHAR